MPRFIPLRPRPTIPAPPVPSLRCNLQTGDSPPEVVELTGNTFLVGSAAVCDLRLPDFVSPPLLCILTLVDGSVGIRRLADEPILLRIGATEPATRISDGDLFTIGPCRLGFQILSRSLPEATPPASAGPTPAAAHSPALDEDLAARRREFDDERQDWERDAERQAEALAARTRQVMEHAAELDRRAEALAQAEARVSARETTLAAAQHALEQEKDELAALRQELGSLRDQLYQQYCRRRDRLGLLRTAVARAAAKVQTEKRALAPALEQLAAREEAARAQHRLIEEWQKESEAEIQARLRALEVREAKLAAAEAALALGKAQQQEPTGEEPASAAILPLRVALTDGNAKFDAGRVAELVTGPVRILEVLRAGPIELIYRALHTDHGVEMLLRRPHPDLSAARQDEYLERFAAAAAVRHENVVATVAILEGPRGKAVLQEWPQGLPGDEWRGAAAVPSVWLRLMQQTAQALAAIHAHGLVHGRLHEGRLLLTAEGLIKLCGLGEPFWLFGDPPPAPQAASPAEDRRALARMALRWLGGSGLRGQRRGNEPLHELIKQIDHSHLSDDALVRAIEGLRSQFADDSAAWQRLLQVVRTRLETAPGELAQAA
jgi:hypothetical protein